MIKERKISEKKSKETIHSNRIKVILEEIGMNQQELADITQLNASHLSKIILGKRRCISLPMYPTLKEEEQFMVINYIIKFYER